MDTERSIILQKKSILLLGIIIICLFSIVYSKFNKVSDVISSNDLQEKNIVVSQSIENEDDILTKSVQLLAMKKYEEDIVSNDEFAFDEASGEESKVEGKENSSNDENVLPENYTKKIEVTATAYCLCKECCGKEEWDEDYGVTATGLKIVKGTDAKVIAVDPKVIPLNSKVYVEGLNGDSSYGYAIAADTGGLIKGNIIDLYMDSHSDTNNWGRRKVNLYILEDE